LHRQPRAAAIYDGVLRESLVTNQYIDLDDHRWSQALLPVRWSDLDIRSVVSLAPSSYILHGFSREHRRAHVVSSPDSIVRSR
jgi:hypothetical protein